jgi:hypothetical protein
MNQPTVEEVVAKLGAPTRVLVENAFAWLDEHEPTWNLDEPIDRWRFIEGLLERQNDRNA